MVLLLPPEPGWQCLSLGLGARRTQLWRSCNTHRPNCTYTLEEGAEGLLEEGPGLLLTVPLGLRAGPGRLSSQGGACLPLRPGQGGRDCCLLGQGVSLLPQRAHLCARVCNCSSPIWNCAGPIGCGSPFAFPLSEPLPPT